MWAAAIGTAVFLVLAAGAFGAGRGAASSAASGSAAPGSVASAVDSPPLATPVDPTPPSRAEYVKRLEAICRPRALATQRAMKGVRADVSKDRLATAAGKFARGTRIFGKTVSLIAAQPKPGADSAKLVKWIGYLRRQEAYLREITAKLRAKRKIKAQRLVARFIHNGNLANNAVLAFGFNYCKFKFSRFG